LYGQSQLRLSDGEVMGVEALVRWSHPRLGLLSPSAFVPLAEQTGLDGPMTAWVLNAPLNDLRREHTAWIQRIHAVLFHQGAEQLGEDGLRTAEGRRRLAEGAAGQLSPAGQVQIATAMRMLEACEVELDQTRRQLVGIARHVRCAKTLTDSIYGVGPITGLALG